MIRGTAISTRIPAPGLLALALMALALSACGESRAPSPDAADAASTTASTSASTRSSASSTSAEASSAPASAGAALPADACALLSDDQIRQSTGHAVSSKAGSGASGWARCDWALASGPGHRISVELRSPGRERYKFVTNGMTAVPGIGDAAAKLGGNIDGNFWALSGDTMVAMQYSLPVTTSDPDPLVLPLLRSVVAQL